MMHDEVRSAKEVCEDGVGHVWVQQDSHEVCGKGGGGITSGITSALLYLQ